MDHYTINRRYIYLVFSAIISCIILVVLVWSNLKFKNGNFFFESNYNFFMELHSEDFSYEHGYLIDGTDFCAEIASPWIGIVDENGISVTSVKINFAEPLYDDTVIQVYFSAAELTEGQSRIKDVKKGTREVIINFPRNVYRELRFDIRGNFKLSSIQLSDDVAASPEDKQKCFNAVLGIIFLSNFIYTLWRYRAYLSKAKFKCLDQIIWFRILALVWGVAFIFLIIPWQTPDEYNHLKMICEGLGNEHLSSVLFEEMPLDRERIMFHSEEKISYEQIRAAARKAPSYSLAECIPRKINKELIRHFPAAVGVFLGILLRVPTYWVIILGRFFSLLFYIGVCSITLRLVPKERELFEVVMLLPMCIQQAASLSYDAVLIPMCFMFIAYIMHLKFVASEIGIRELVILSVIFSCIAIVKIPYILMGGLFFIIPISKIHIGWSKYEITGDMIYKWRWVLSICSLITVFVIIYLFRKNQWIRLVYASICQLPQTLYLFRATWKNFAEHLLVSLIGNFGYLDTPTGLWFVVGGITFIIMTAMTHIKNEVDEEDKQKELWNGRDRVIMFSVWILSTYVITLSMVSHTAKILFYGTESVNVQLNWQEILYQIPYIGGGQGRYYIPILLLVLLPMPKIYETKEKIYRIFCSVFIMVAITYTCSIIYHRFWYV